MANYSTLHNDLKIVRNYSPLPPDPANTKQFKSPSKMPNQMKNVYLHSLGMIGTKLKK